MYEILKHAHSGFRWVLLLLLIVSILVAVRSWSREASSANMKLFLFTMVSAHIQLLLGLVLYFMDMGNKVRFGAGMMENSTVRFFTIEHLVGMLLAITLITVGRKKAKKNPLLANRKVFTWYFVALVLILISIPWPGYRNLGGAWF